MLQFLWWEDYLLFVMMNTFRHRLSELRPNENHVKIINGFLINEQNMIALNAPFQVSMKNQKVSKIETDRPFDIILLNKNCFVIYYRQFVCFLFSLLFCRNIQCNNVIFTVMLLLHEIFELTFDIRSCVRLTNVESRHEIH